MITLTVTDQAGIVHAAATGPGLLCKRRTWTEAAGVTYELGGRRVYSGSRTYR